MGYTEGISPFLVFVGCGDVIARIVGILQKMPLNLSKTCVPAFLGGTELNHENLLCQTEAGFVPVYSSRWDTISGDPTS
jgi:hypothetical protein